MKMSRWLPGGISKRGVELVILLAVSGVMSGCGALRYLMYIVAPGSQGKWVAAECEAMSEGKLVLVLVYADESIQYRSQVMARYNTSAAVAEELETRLRVETVDPASVESFQANNLKWTDSNPSTIGRRFGADLVLYIELQEYTTRAEESGELLRGQMKGSAVLYAVPGAGDEKTKRLWAGKAKAVYPEDMPEIADIYNEQVIRFRTLGLFSENLVKHFYGHYEDN